MLGKARSAVRFERRLSRDEYSVGRSGWKEWTSSRTVLFSRKRQDAVDVDGYARKLVILQNILSWVGESNQREDVRKGEEFLHAQVQASDNLLVSSWMEQGLAPVVMVSLSPAHRSITEHGRSWSTLFLPTVASGACR